MSQTGIARLWLSTWWMFHRRFEPIFGWMTAFWRSVKYSKEIKMTPPSPPRSKSGTTINWKLFIPLRQGRAPVFCCWLNAIHLSLSQLRITAKRMSMKVMGKRTENEGWASLRIITRRVSMRSASVSVKPPHPRWWWLIRFSHAQQITLIGRNIPLQLNSRLTCADSIVNTVRCAAC